MTELAADVKQPPPGVVVALDSQQVKDHWDIAVAPMLRAVQQWTQLIVPEDLKQPLSDGSIRLFGVRDHAGLVFVALASILQGVVGRTCRGYLFVTPLASDATVAALIDEIETYGRLNGCHVLAVDAHPDWAHRIAGKVTAITVERDLRATRKEMN